MSIDLGLFELIRRAKYPSGRVEFSFCAIIVFVAIVLATLLHQVGIITLLTTDSRSTVYLTLALYVGFALLAVALWTGFTQAYLRSGKPPKIGLIYSGHTSNINDVERVRETVADLYAQGKLGHETSSLRYMPTRAVKSDQRAQRYMKRYDLDLLVHITQSTNVSSNVPAFSSKFHFGGPHKIQLPTINAALHALVTLPKARVPRPPILHLLLDASATTLHNQLLLIIAVHAVVAQRWLDAAALLRFLDNTLQSGAQPNIPPRSIIRQFDALSRLRACTFKTNEIPPPDALLERAQIAETASCYAVEIPGVATAIARVFYFAGHSERALTIIDSALKALPDPQAPIDVYLVIAKAFLEFIHFNWSNAGQWYSKLLKHPDLRKLDWVTDLVPFANHVASFNVEGSHFLQALYYRIAQMPLSDDLKRSARAWTQSDPSRGQLANVLRDTGGQPLDTSNDVSPVVKGKNKRKRRKKA